MELDQVQSVIQQLGLNKPLYYQVWRLIDNYVREEVLVQFPRTAGCTHLNDMLRALADVPALARQLPAAS